MRIVWTALAVRSMDGIGEYISRDNPKAATQLLGQIRRSALLLKQNPFLGRRSEFNGVRELVVHPNYLLTYRVSTEAVEILQVWHAAQNRFH